MNKNNIIVSLSKVDDFKYQNGVGEILVVGKVECGRAKSCFKRHKDDAIRSSC